MFRGHERKGGGGGSRSFVVKMGFGGLDVMCKQESRARLSFPSHLICRLNLDIR